MNPTTANQLSLPNREFSVSEKQQWRRGIMDIYDRMRTKAKNGPYEVEFGDISLTVLPKVYSATSFTDTFWFAEQLQDVVGQASLLEIGTGTGAIAIFSARNGAAVVATDVNSDAVKNASLNVKNHNLDISVREGNLYEPIHLDEKFDFIFWAHPFNNWETPVEDMLLRSGLDHEYKSLKSYIREAKDYLSPKGKLLLGTGDTADLKTIASTAQESGYSLKLLRQITMPLEKGTETMITYLIYEFVPN